METFLKIFVSIGKVLHWFTGFFVHPEKGGCCNNSFDDCVEKKEKE